MQPDRQHTAPAPKVCNVAGCQRRPIAKGLCNMHRMRRTRGSSNAAAPGELRTPSGRTSRITVWIRPEVLELIQKSIGDTPISEWAAGELARAAERADRNRIRQHQIAEERRSQR